jgi:hypothetical protein
MPGAYATIESVQRVLILSGTAVRAEILRQGEETPEIVVGTKALRLASVGYAGPLADFYTKAAASTLHRNSETLDHRVR